MHLYRLEVTGVDRVFVFFGGEIPRTPNWSLDRKETFANDPRNLLAVDDGLNQAKGAKGPTQWMPPNHSYRCEYLIHWQQVLTWYPELKMTPKENRIFERQLLACE